LASKPVQKQQSGEAEPNVVAVAQSRFSGPLPHPDHLARYNEILPDAAERILAMAEKEQDHRHNLEKKVMRNDFAITVAGQFLTCALIGGGLISGVLLIMADKEVGGLVSLVSSLAAFGGILFWKNKSKGSVGEKN
jgi:uncharacterized membrane protein